MSFSYWLWVLLESLQTFSTSSGLQAAWNLGKLWQKLRLYFSSIFSICTFNLHNFTVNGNLLKWILKANKMFTLPLFISLFIFCNRTNLLFGSYGTNSASLWRRDATSLYLLSSAAGCLLLPDNLQTSSLPASLLSAHSLKNRSFSPTCTCKVGVYLYFKKSGKPPRHAGRCSSQIRHDTSCFSPRPLCRHGVSCSKHWLNCCQGIPVVSMQGQKHVFTENQVDSFQFSATWPQKVDWAKVQRDALELPVLAGFSLWWNAYDVHLFRPILK